ncbi:MAG: YaeQ family protein [Myxococcales bacterium]
MALAPALCDFEIELQQVDTGLAAKLRLRTARHPSETFERVWLRVLAYCLYYRERLAFGPGLSDPDTPDLIETDLTGQPTHWIRVGKADPQRIQRAADRNPRVSVLFESPPRLAAFLAEARKEGLGRLGEVELAAVDPALLRGLAANEERRAKASVTIVGDHFYVQKDGESLDGPIERARL